MRALCNAFLLAAFLTPTLCSAQQSAETATAHAVQNILGSVTAIDQEFVTISPASGAPAKVQVPSDAQIVRTAPGQKDLKDATRITLKDVQVGDRVLARARPASADAPAMVTALIVMKQSDIAERQQREVSEWQQRGVGGLVTAIDQAAATVTISNAGFGGIRQITIHAAPATVIRRYTAGSVKFEDAKPARLEEVKPGDQLRARGKRSSDDLSIAADEIVFGSFRNLAGPLTAVDPAHNTFELQDLLSKKKVMVRISAASQVRKLPQMIAERIGAQLKSGSAAPSETPLPHPEAQPADGRVRFAGGARADFQQLLNRLPPIQLTDLQKGDVILMVATEGEPGSAPVAITIVGGAEPILSAAPDASRAAMLLSPWNLGSSSSADAGAAP